MRKLSILFFILVMVSCKEEATKLHADLLVINANTYTVNSNFDKAEAFAIKDGKFIAVGSAKELKKNYKSDHVIDAENQTVLPGLIDAHCHFYGLGLNQLKVDLKGTSSLDDVLNRVVAFQKEKNKAYIIGRGWDQNDWENTSFPNKEKLDALFPKVPVVLTRVDGHAMLCNQVALDLAGITVDTKVSGGEILKENNKLTGVVIDNPMLLVEATFPKMNRQQQITALKEAQDICVKNGLTTVSDAGLDKDVIQLIDSLQQAKVLDMRVYAMISNSKENLDYYLSKGKIKTDRLNVQSIKVYGDGALGSRGAALKKSYTDKENHFGALVIGVDEFKSLAEKLAASDFQMNTHAIGDSTNRLVLQTYNKVLKGKTDRRWRVEHAQVLTDDDMAYFKNENIIPSIQPTHATSDMYWAEDRLGEERIKGAYAYKSLLNASGRVALGTDFPVEQVSPFLTFYASVARKDVNDYPKNGFNAKESLTREETLKGMTIWAAYSNFEDQEKGSIEVGKFADFIILNQNIMEVDTPLIPMTKVIGTYINGEKI